VSGDAASRAESLLLGRQSNHPRGPQSLSMVACAINAASQMIWKPDYLTSRAAKPVSAPSGIA